MAVDRLDAAAAVADSTTLSYAISAGSNRALVVAVTQEEDGTLEAPTVSYGGQSLGAFAAASGILIDGGTQAAIHFFRLLEAGIAAASDTTITVSGATLNAKAIHARSYTGVDQVDPITPVNGADYSETGTSSPNPLTDCAVDVLEGGACVACGLTGQNNSGGTWANVTQQTALTAGSTMGSSLADSLEAAAATVNPRRTWNSQNRAIVAAIALVPAAEAGVTGTGAQTLPALEQSGSGEAEITASGAQALPSVEQAGSGEAEIVGNGAQALPSVEQSGTGAFAGAVSGSAAQSLPALSSAGAGAFTPASAGSLKADAWAVASDLPLVLLTIEHDDLAAPIRVVNDKADLTSRGEVFTRFPFEIQLPDSLEDAPPNARLRIDNVSREIGQAIRDIDSAATVTIEVVRRVTPNVVELSFPALRLFDVQYDALTVSGELRFEDLTREPYPALSFSPANFPGLVR